MTGLYKTTSKRVLFLTTANLATNPRLVKEIALMKGLEGVAVEVVSFRLGNWGDALEKGLEEPGVRYHYLNATRSPRGQWLMATLAGTWYEARGTLDSSLSVSAFAVSKRSWQLIRFLKRAKLGAFDLVIAHNIGALYPAWVFSQQQGGRFAFDAEDYHPGEKAIDKEPVKEKRRREQLMKTILPQAAYVSCASPLIEEATLTLTGDGELRKRSFVVNNTFSYREFDWSSPQSRDPQIRMIWFSQNVSPGRGLEQILPALSPFRGRVKLTIIGNLLDEMKPLLEEHAAFVEWRPPMAQADLHRELQHYDVGLALEQSAEDLNKALALSNKIFAYHLAGLYILATDTPAQRQFLEVRPYAGKVVEDLGLPATIQLLSDELTGLRRNRSVRMLQARSDAWEPESGKLLHTWQQLLSLSKTSVNQP